MNLLTLGDVNFNVLNEIAHGSYGVVFKVKLKEIEYALKIIENSEKEGIKSLKEIDIMSRIYHPNLMHSQLIISDYNEKEKIVRTGILMKLADRDLYEASRDPKFSIKDRLNILYQVTDGLKYLHNSNYLHLDIKPLNILIFNDNKIGKLTDFGISLILNDVNGKKFKDYPNRTMTIDHRSIEALEGNRKYTTADDIWSLGITFLEVLSNGKSLFSRFEKHDFVEDKVKKVFIDYLSPNMIDKTLNSFLNNLKNPIKNQAIKLIKEMLSFEPSKRPSTEKILKSPLFSSIKSIISKNERVNPPIIKSECDYMIYEGFDTLVRIGSRLPISLETFFLANDIYQRTLNFRHPKTDNTEEDYKNTVYLATIALYMAAKMIESFFIDTKTLIELAGNLFTTKNLIFGESFLSNSLEGILYPENLFTASTTLERLLLAFEISRNCFVYPYIDLKEWKLLNDEEEKTTTKFNKYIPFNKFLGKTEYYAAIKDDSERNYINSFYKKDLEENVE